MSAPWWPKPPYHNEQDPALSVGFDAGVQAAMEAVAERLREEHLVLQLISCRCAAHEEANRVWLGLDPPAAMTHPSSKIGG